MRLVYTYIVIGVCWQLFGIFAPTEASAAVRNKFSGLTGWQFCQRALGALLGSLAWPLWAILAFAPWLMPNLADKVQTQFRREYLDREDLLKPQMPAARCYVCGGAMDRIERACSECGVAWNVDHCPNGTSCCNGNCFVHRDTGWLCPKCSPPDVHTCTGCGGQILVSRDGSGNVDVQHTGAAHVRARCDAYDAILRMTGGCVCERWRALGKLIGNTGPLRCDKCGRTE
jgi:hypothetical protein